MGNDMSASGKEGLQAGFQEAQGIHGGDVPENRREGKGREGRYILG